MLKWSIYSDHRNTSLTSYNFYSCSVLSTIGLYNKNSVQYQTMKHSFKTVSINQLYEMNTNRTKCKLFYEPSKT